MDGLKFSELSKQLNNHYTKKRENEKKKEEDELEKIKSLAADFQNTFDNAADQENKRLFDNSSPVLSESSDYSNLDFLHSSVDDSICNFLPTSSSSPTTIIPTAGK